MLLNVCAKRFLWIAQLGELGKGAGKGGGGGGSIREAGGSMGKKQAAEEEMYFKYVFLPFTAAKCGQREFALLISLPLT